VRRVYRTEERGQYAKWQCKVKSYGGTKVLAKKVTNFHLLSINIHKCQAGRQSNHWESDCRCNPVEPYPVNKYFLYSKKLILY
jgi:hypothetical protein